MTFVLRAGLRLFTPPQSRKDRSGLWPIDVFVEILPDLHHRCIDASAEALDLHPAEHAICRDRLWIGRDVLLASGDNVVRSREPAWRRRAHLDEMAPDRGEIEHGVEGRDFEDADRGHAEKARDLLDHGFGDPAFLFLA